MRSSRLAKSPGPGPTVRLFAWVAGRISRTNPPNLFLTLGRHGRLFWGWLHFASALMPRGRLPRRITEMSILRVASMSRCEYELQHHRRLAKRAGLSDAEVASAEQGHPAESFSALERAVMHAVEVLHKEQDLDDESFERLNGLLTEPQIVELVMLVGHYSMLATTVRVLRIEPDREAA